MFKIGDKVVIKDSYECYSQSLSMYHKLILEDSKPFKFGEMPKCESIAIVKNIGKHPYDNHDIYMIETEDQSYLFNENGLEFLCSKDDEVLTVNNEYNIRDGQIYNIVFKHEMDRGMDKVSGEILNFCPAQVVLKSKKGLYILSPKNIIEMVPIN